LQRGYNRGVRRSRGEPGMTAEIAVIHASEGKFGLPWQRSAERFAFKYADRLPAGHVPPKWSFARMHVDSRDAIVREFPLQRLVAISRRLRAAYPPPPE
jgi:hypothetical protein